MSSQTQELEQALQALRLQTANTAEATQAVSTLAENSRSDPDVRLQLSDPQVLQKLVGFVEYSVNRHPTTTSSALRCIGNACIDNDEARATLTNLGFSWARQCLHGDDEVLWLAVKALYNICSEYDAAQLQCYREHIHYELIDMCASPLALGSDDRSLLIDLLFWITSQKANVPEEAASEPLPAETLLRLLNLPYYHLIKADLDDLATILEIGLTFLRDASTQTQIVGHHWAGYVWQMLQDVESKIALRELSGQGPPETKEVLKPYSASLIWTLSDIAANPKFAETYNLDDGWINALIQTIKEEAAEFFTNFETDIVDQSELGARLYREARQTRGNPEGTDPISGGQRLVCAACQIIGNLLWALPSDQATPLVEEAAIHVALWRMLVVPDGVNDEDLLHSAASLLVQLTRPSQHVRELIGADEKAKDALTALCGHKTPQIKQIGVKLLRALGRDCPLNQERFGSLAADLTVAAAEDAPMVNGA
ncbi:hypothetical protein LTR36_006640 [Oleoguttula mirabilis]|uniref:Uncharacterized protein n=1 Tax=Oleoguttula mirabilis TaxID=1507867 RepID=A0AAV9JCQ8_9PEZI|nr:hypothetical protein LTR36_006640 [Oleoguttula mirabilis]